MKIRTTHDPKPIPDRSYDWTAIDDDTYDGADDSGERTMVGCGATEAEAVEDLMRLKQERAEYFEDLHFAEYEDRLSRAEYLEDR